MLQIYARQVFWRNRSKRGTKTPVSEFITKKRQFSYAEMTWERPLLEVGAGHPIISILYTAKHKT